MKEFLLEKKSCSLDNCILCESNSVCSFCEKGFYSDNTNSC